MSENCNVEEEISNDNCVIDKSLIQKTRKMKCRKKEMELRRTIFSLRKSLKKAQNLNKLYVNSIERKRTKIRNLIKKNNRLQYHNKGYKKIFIKIFTKFSKKYKEKRSLVEILNKIFKNSRKKMLNKYYCKKLLQPTIQNTPNSLRAANIRAAIVKFYLLDENSTRVNGAKKFKTKKKLRKNYDI